MTLFHQFAHPATTANQGEGTSGFRLPTVPLRIDGEKRRVQSCGARPSPSNLHTLSPHTTHTSAPHPLGNPQDLAMGVTYPICAIQAGYEEHVYR